MLVPITKETFVKAMKAIIDMDRKWDAFGKAFKEVSGSHPPVFDIGADVSVYLLEASLDDSKTNYIKWWLYERQEALSNPYERVEAVVEWEEGELIRSANLATLESLYDFLADK